MGTAYYEVCPLCLSGEKHYHRKDDIVIAHSHYGGEEKGFQLTISDLIRDDVLLVDEYGDPWTVKQLKNKVGTGR